MFIARLLFVGNILGCFLPICGGLSAEEVESSGLRGVTIESILTLDTVGNVSGGVRRDAAFLGNFDLTFTVDTEQAFTLPGGTLFVYLLGTFGEAPSTFVGDTQTSDNIEAEESFKVYEAWYEQLLFDGDLSLRAGLHDYNTEFYALNYSANLLNSSFGVGVDVAQVEPSIFPTTALAARVKIKPFESGYMMGAIYDGVPGDPENPRGTHIILDNDDGLFYAGEIGFAGDEGDDYFKAGLGFWYRTTDFEDVSGTVRAHNHGVYLIAEGSVRNGLGLFLQIGLPRESRNQISHYLGAGLAYTGLFPGRDKDILSFGVAHASNSDNYLEATEGALNAETALELNYRAELTSNISLTPDLQWIIDPGTMIGVEDALVLGLRLEVAI